MYLGRWHSSEVAIKCLNPSLFFSGSDGTASKAAMADLLREADLLASLRHPNVVWVYGVVLPKVVRLQSFLLSHAAAISVRPIYATICLRANPQRSHVFHGVGHACMHHEDVGYWLWVYLQQAAPPAVVQLHFHPPMHIEAVLTPLAALPIVRSCSSPDAEVGDCALEQEPEDGRLLYDETDPIPMASGANLGRSGNLRPPAVVTEFMSQGSVKQALARKSDVVSGNMHRLVVAMDAAKVGLFQADLYCLLTANKVQVYKHSCELPQSLYHEQGSILASAC